MNASYAQCYSWKSIQQWC